MTAILLSPWTAYGLTLAAVTFGYILGRLMERKAWIRRLADAAEPTKWPPRPGRNNAVGWEGGARCPPPPPPTEPVRKGQSWGGGRRP